MSLNYQVLARKWRPRSFQEMVGQEHVLRMLTNALTLKRLHHAYLFTGTRGVGKTSLARILAKCLNCETGIQPIPCGQCTACQAIDAGRFLDLIEVDAASRTKVEDTRDLLENIQYAPAQGRYKIYLIDEVHMLSGHSFNALLKTLEEPPSHVIFILATTDPKKLPITILSRCLQFNLKRVLPEQITAQLQQICQAEKIPFELPALELIAHAADGSMRDALSLLDQTIAFCGAQITTSDTRRMLGTVEQDYLFRLLHALKEQNGKKLLEEIAALAQYAPDFNRVIEELLTILHQINIAQIVKETQPAPSIAQLAQLFSPEEVQLYYQIGLIARRDLALAPSPLLGFEMMLLRMLAFQPSQKAAIPKHVIPAKNPAVSWSELVNQLKLTGLAHTLASNCELKTMTDTRLELSLSKTHAPMLNPKLQQRIEEALVSHLQKSVKLEIQLTTDEVTSPAKQTQTTQDSRKVQAADAIKNDEQVKKWMEVFDAKLDEDSVRPL